MLAISPGFYFRGLFIFEELNSAGYFCCGISEQVPCLAQVEREICSELFGNGLGALPISALQTSASSFGGE